jgi:hypothetical protein
MNAFKYLSNNGNPGGNSSNGINNKGNNMSTSKSYIRTSKLNLNNINDDNYKE